MSSSTARWALVTARLRPKLSPVFRQAIAMFKLSIAIGTANGRLLPGLPIEPGFESFVRLASVIG